MNVHGERSTSYLRCCFSYLYSSWSWIEWFITSKKWITFCNGRIKCILHLFHHKWSFPKREKYRGRKEGGKKRKAFWMRLIKVKAEIGGIYSMRVLLKIEQSALYRENLTLSSANTFPRSQIISDKGYSRLMKKLLLDCDR